MRPVCWILCALCAGVAPVAAAAKQTRFVMRLENMASARLFAADGTFDTPAGKREPGPALPGQAYRFRFSAPPGSHLSFAAMYAQSNDLFYAPPPQGIALWDGDKPISGDFTDRVLLWDAGTEMNQPPGKGADQAPRQAMPGAGAEERNVVRPVDDGFAYGADNIRVEARALGPMDFEVEIAILPDSPTPLAPGIWLVHSRPHPLFKEGMAAGYQGLESLAEDGDPAPLAAILEKWAGVTLLLAPGAWAVHQGANPLFSPGTPAGDRGLEALAEDGDPAPLATWVSGRSGVRASGVLQMLDNAAAAGPLIPGGAYELRFAAEPGDRLSFAFMFVQSNDLFYAPGADGIPLFQGDIPISGDITDRVLLWDAGTEINQLPGIGADQAPRQSADNTGVREMGAVWPVNDGFAYPEIGQVLKVTLRPE